MSGKPELRGRAARLARLLPAERGQAARTPFVVLVVLLLGGGLIGLLVLNSALSEGAFRLGDLENETKSLTDEEQALQRDVDAHSAPDALQRRARELGMVPGGDPAFLDPDGTVKGVPGPASLRSRSVPLVLPPGALASGPPSPAPALPAPSGADTEPPALSGAASEPVAPSPEAPADPAGTPTQSSENPAGDGSGR